MHRRRLQEHGRFRIQRPAEDVRNHHPGHGSFSNNVVLTTQFGSRFQCAGAGQCARIRADPTEVRVQNTVAGGSGISSDAARLPGRTVVPGLRRSRPSTSPARGVPSFEVCLGATWIGAAGADAPWRPGPGDRRPRIAVEAGKSNVYWGWVPDCAAVTAYADNPCFELRTKSANQLQSTLGLTKNELKALDYKSGDLAFVIEKPSPWDGKFTARWSAGR